jgi:hypothetical protein
MSARTSVLSVLLGCGILVAVAAAVLAFRGTGPEALRGAALGLLGGTGGSVLEVVMVRRALSRPRGSALGIILGGFLLRLVVLVVAALLLNGSGIADAASFALCFLGGFLSSLPVLALSVPGARPHGNGEAQG